MSLAWYLSALSCVILRLLLAEIASQTRRHNRTTLQAHTGNENSYLALYSDNYHAVALTYLVFEQSVHFVFVWESHF
jgi:NADH:ubiquinone oxidoreductase subunit 3 (subunit A)